MNNLSVEYKESQHTPSEKLKTHTMSHVDLSLYQEGEPNVGQNLALVL